MPMACSLQYMIRLRRQQAAENGPLAVDSTIALVFRHMERWTMAPGQLIAV